MTSTEIAAIPKSQQPRVKATFVAGGAGVTAGTLLIGLWNSTFPEFSPFHLGTTEAAAVASALTGFLAGIAGPLMRRLDAWLEGGGKETRDLIALNRRIADQEQLSREIAVALKSLRDQIAALQPEKASP